MKGPIITLILLTALAGASYGQEVVVIGTEVLRTVEPASRLEEQPKVIDTAFKTPVANFPLLSMSYEPFIEVKPIEAAKVKMTEKLPQLYNGYARVGIGSVFMPLADIYYNNTRTRKYNYGFHLNHLSSFGGQPKVAPSGFDRTNIRGFGGVYEKKYDWQAELNYNTQGFHYYGFPNERADEDSIANRFHTFSGKAGFASHQHDSLGVNWNIGAQYRHFNERKPYFDTVPEDWRASENYFALSGGASFKWGEEIFSADADIKYNGYKYGTVGDTLLNALDTGIVINNTLISLRPSITTYGRGNRLKARIGVDLTLTTGTLQTKPYVYPNAEVKYSLFDDILIPYAGLRGGMKQQTFKSLTDVNEFILSNVELRNEHKAIEAYIGLKGTLSRRVGFNISAGFGHIKDKALFVTDTTFSGGNRFAVIYDTMNVATIEGSLSYQLLEKTKIDLLGRFYSYNTLFNAYAWNLPQVEIFLRGSHNLYDKFIFNLDLTFYGGRRALVYDPEEEDVVQENGQLAKKLGLIADVNLGVEYRYNKRISAFVNLNNLAAQRYQRWYQYPVQGLQVMGGLTFRF
jgi:hypothetical protein